MKNRPRLAHWPDGHVIEVVETALANIVAARDAMWHSPKTDSDNFNTAERYAEFNSSDDELVDAIQALEKFLGPTEEEAQAREEDQRTAAEWRARCERFEAALEEAKRRLAAYRKAAHTLKGVES